MATYLLTWNSEPENWNKMEDDIKNLQQKGTLERRWSCGNTKKISVGDRVFLIKLGKQPKGVVASGWVVSYYYEDEHWDYARALKGDKANYVKINFDTILESSKVLPYNSLKTNVSAQMNWSPFASGVTIDEEIADKLEEEWSNFIGKLRIARNDVFPDESETEKTFLEGAVKVVKVNYYERDKQAREVCINHYKPICSVCEFDFGKKYGEIGKGYIHVHHLKPLSEIGKEYKLNPINDLRPVCPNCHAMLHRRKPALSIEELREIIK